MSLFKSIENSGISNINFNKHTLSPISSFCILKTPSTFFIRVFTNSSISLFSKLSFSFSNFSIFFISSDVNSFTNFLKNLFSFNFPFIPFIPLISFSISVHFLISLTLVHYHCFFLTIATVVVVVAIIFSSLF